MTTNFTKTASSHLDDTGAAYDTLSAPVAVVTPGQGKHAEHADAHRADMRGSTIKHVGHTLPKARGMRHAPEGPKKGGLYGWGTNDPEEVLEDQSGVGEKELQGFMAPESETEEQRAWKEAIVESPEEAKTLTLDEFEKQRQKA